nr:hypothetical protein [uncultured Pedobacter sp.]
MNSKSSGYLSLSLVFLLTISTVKAQKLKTEEIAYSYSRLPSTAIKNVKHYQVTFEPAYEAKNKELLEEYRQKKKEAQEKYRNDVAAYSTLVKAANERYEKAMADYNKKTLGAKIVEKSLLDNSKPKKEVIQQPYMENIAPPKLQASYDYKTVADTYIQLDGYEKNPADALKIIVLLYGFDYTIPRTINEEQERQSFGDGKSSSYKVTLYHTEFSYRYPMAVKVYTPQGSEILSITPPELNSYKIYKSANTDRPVEINGELLIKTHQEKVLQENLGFINNLLNDKFGYSTVNKTATLYYIKNGDADYADLTTAFNEASSGLLMLQQDRSTGVEKLKKACDIWNTALKESDISNKKSRINKDVTIGIYFNLLESYFAIGDAAAGQNTLGKLNTLSLSNTERVTKLGFDKLFSELKKRQSQN